MTSEKFQQAQALQTSITQLQKHYSQVQQVNKSLFAYGVHLSTYHENIELQEDCVPPGTLNIYLDNVAQRIEELQKKFSDL